MLTKYVVSCDSLTFASTNRLGRLLEASAALRLLENAFELLFLICSFYSCRGYRHAGIDVNTEAFNLDGDDIDEDEYAEDFPPGLFNRHLDEMMASFTECTPKHNHLPTLGSYTPVSPLPSTPQHMTIPQQQPSPSPFNGNPPTPGSYTPISPLSSTPLHTEHRNVHQRQQSPLVLTGIHLLQRGTAHHNPLQH